MTHHSPTPWRIHSKWICDANNNLVFFDENGNDEIIVKAVNRDHAFAALVEALEAAEFKLKYYEPHNNYPDGSRKDGPSEILVKARAALALAKGGV